MWFKQLSFFTIDSKNIPTAELLEEKLATAAFAPVTGLALSSEGFAAAVPFAPEHVFTAGKSMRIALKKEEKILPAAVVREVLEEKVAEIQAAEARAVGRREKMELKEQITDDLLPRAFSKSSHTVLIFAPENGFLLVNQSAANRSENAVSRLREALGGLEVKLPDTVQSPSALMTEWLLAGDAAGGFSLDEDCELKGTGEAAAVVRVSRQDLTADEVVQHVKNGKIVTRLGLVWQDKVSFVLGADLSLKRIRFLDMLQEEAADAGDDVASLTAATQIVMTETLSVMLCELLKHLGGLIER
ncbi:MAG: recombination-associated protein RdgC [Neisseria sp.]|nr:recombination-associated protein RdgC [Neisseria sp.]